MTIPDSTDSRLVENLDVTPTALKAAGLTTNRTPAIDGLSLFDPANSRQPAAVRVREPPRLPADRPVPQLGLDPDGDVPVHRELRGGRRDVVFREYYDLVNDPDQQLQPVRAGWPAGRRRRPRHAGAAGRAARTSSSGVTASASATQCPPGPGAPAADDRHEGPERRGLAADRERLRLLPRKAGRARALDNLGVTGVQFKVDGNTVGPEITEDPFTTIWDATGVPRASMWSRPSPSDAAGNTRHVAGRHDQPQRDGRAGRERPGQRRAASRTAATRSPLLRPPGQSEHGRSAGTAPSPPAVPRRRPPDA